MTPVDQFRLPYTTCSEPLWIGATSMTDGHSSRMASTSSSDMVGSVPDPMRAPPDEVEPENTISRLLPMELISLEIRWRAAAPMDSMAITAATPMMMPSMVRLERILLARRARRAMVSVEAGLIMA